MGGTASSPEPARATTTPTTTSTFHQPTREGLLRMYGYFRCPTCRQQWESSHVYSRQATLTTTSQAAYGQECKKCRVMCMPYRVEKIICSGCGETKCICVEKRERHIDPNKHHRRDLCAKCKAGLPCTRGF